ncbi:MAG TPA: response regulator [Polyangiaceae bacterium]|jgi:DNA-binding response OmpR family regulator|nr:response regulator [Polyangiaceae bacterium]
MTGTQILVVDDDVAFGELTCRRLERLGYVPKLIPGARGVLSEVVSNNFAAVLLDVNMPALSGPELMQSIRSRPVKVMLYSSTDTSDLRSLAHAHGADAYLNKSASSKELEIRLREMLLGAKMSDPTLLKTE